MPFNIVRDDICRRHADAIVCATNNELREGGGVVGAIFAAAGRRRLTAACAKIGHVDTGDAVATKAYSLPARHIIHTAGPVWHAQQEDEDLLRSCYRRSLEVATGLGDKSVAFPLISGGTNGFPIYLAARIAREEISAYLTDHELDVTLVIFGSDALQGVRDADVERYIDDAYVQEHLIPRRMWEGRPRRPSSAERPWRLESYEDMSEPSAADAMASAPVAASAPMMAPSRTPSLDEILKDLDAGFSETLITLIDARRMTDVEVYKRANMSRQHFSKIRNNRRYRPKKETVLALAVALRLTVPETRDLLARAGFALTHADKRDIIVEYHLTHGIYDVNVINICLFDYDQPLLG